MATPKKPVKNCDICGKPCRHAHALRCSPDCIRESKRRRDAAYHAARHKAHYATNKTRQNERSRAYYAAHREELLAKKRQRWIEDHAGKLIRCLCGRWHDPLRYGDKHPKFFCSPACRERQTLLITARIVAVFHKLKERSRHEHRRVA